MADASNVEKKYIYQISRSGVFLGVLQNVISEFTFSQDINTAGTALNIVVGDTPDRQFEAPEPILTEDGLPITDELGQTLLTERQPDIVGNVNSKALIRNNNTIAVYEISPDYPNGKLVFSGWISRWKASFGGNDNIEINCLSNGSDLDNYLILGNQVIDQSQLVQNSTQSVDSQVKSGAFDLAGQTFQVGAGVTVISSIIVKLFAAVPVLARATLNRGFNGIYGSGSTIGQASQTLPATGINGADFTFTFPTPVIVSPGEVLFFQLDAPFVDINSGFSVFYQNSDVYASYSMYSMQYSGTGTPVWITGNSSGAASDLYFKTAYTAGATSAPYSSQDPTSILRDIVDNYVARGGVINYATGTTVLTNTTRSYTFKVNTVLEGIKKCLELAPFDWYWYVDPATSIIYFKETSTTADHKMIYGRHIESLDVVASVEEVKTQAYFTGGDTGGNVYLYQSLGSASALAANAGRVGLARLTDNRVTLSDTALALMTNYLNDHNAENYQTTIRINSENYDITTMALGQTIGFAGFGSFVDNLLLQIVHIERHIDYVVLGLGVLPRRASAKVEEIQRTLNDVATIYNPTAPS